MGSLKAASSGVETMLEGTLTTLPANGDVLTLKFLSPSYATQGGTLEYIAANCDYATASVTVLGIDGTDVTTTGAVFENQQSIVKFTLQDKDNSNAAISATEMIVVADGHTYSIHTTPATNEFFVALPSFSNKNIQVTAANDTDMFNFVRENITIECGKYYTMTMQMDKFANKVVDLSTLTGNYVAMNGAVLTGTLHSNCQISIAAGASITLNNASINAVGDINEDTDWAGITCLGNATITLVGTNVVNACYCYFPGIQAGPENTTLTINGTGSLIATGYNYAAGIGSGDSATCGDISINGGAITATGGSFAAGIGTGGGEDAKCGDISISDGTITAKGGDMAAGIGTGNDGKCGDISISGGTITATGGDYAAGIGSGDSATCGNISISGGTITATGGDYAAGIGSGRTGSCGNISISGTASGSAKGGENSLCDIGPGNGGTCGTVSVQENTISGSYPGQLITCTFTVNFQFDGALNNMVKTDKITITCNGKTYTALRADEVGSYIRTGDSVQVDLPAGNNMPLTFTAECTFVTNSNPVGTFSATVGNVTITESSSTLNEVTLVKQ